MSWKRWLVNKIGARPPLPVAALVYALGGRFYSRWIFGAQGESVSASGSGRLTVSFDIDYPEDAQALEQLCDLLARLEIRASFAVVGALVERFPSQHRRLVEDGHELLNHTFNHPDNEVLCPDRTFDQLTLQEQASEIELCTTACRDILGAEVAGFRAPHFGNVTGREFYKLLAEQGYRYSTSVLAPGSKSCGLPYLAAEGIWEFPVSTCPAHPFAVLDTWHSLRKPGARHRRRGQLAALYRELVGMAEDSGGYLNLYLDPRDAVGYEDAAAALGELAPGKHNLKLLTCQDYLQQLV